MTLSKIQAEKMIDQLKQEEIALGRDPTTWYAYENHVYGVAKIAKAIASKIPTMNANRVYIMGLLHDICRTEEDRYQRFHGILGYEKLIKLDKDVANCCLSHTFPWNELLSYHQCAKYFYHNKADYEFLANFFKNTPAKEEDYLIQLCDNLANKDGLVTIEQRAKELIQRRGPLYVTLNGLKKAKELKRYFDKKIGCDIYSLFKQL